jgi:mono/diheme cytochrome c family protein
MRYGHSLACAGLVAATFLFTSCSVNNGDPADTIPGVSQQTTITGPNSFLLFPNPQIQPSGSSEIDSLAYSQAYYEAIDPNNDKDTLAKWKTANGFGTPAGPLGEVSAIYGDWRDLAYGRRVTARQNSDGTIAIVADNYIVNAGGDYTSDPAMNLAAVVAQDRRWFIGATAIEFSPGPGGTVNFAKFYYFDPSGVRSLVANLDGRGNKSVIGVCASCHGGRADPLTPAAGSSTGKALFPLVQNSASLSRGDIQIHPHPLEVGSLGFPKLAGMTRADQEAAMKTMNKIILCTFPISATATPAAEDACRRTATANEWQGEADTLIKGAYGGDGLPSLVYVDTPTPASWATAGQSTLYQNVVAPACRVCHILRGTGTGAGDDIDFDSYTNFNGSADEIKAHIIDKGNMPLSKILYERFWATPAMQDSIATFLVGAGYTPSAVIDTSGALLKPGRPVADPGPDRITDSPATLSAANSLYATNYAWSIVSGSGGSLGATANSVQATLIGSAGTTYVLQLVVGNGATQSAPAQVNVTIATAGSSALPIAASAIQFADIKNILQTAGCTGCHTTGTTTLMTAAMTPLVYTNVDRNGDGNVGDATDDQWFYTEVRGRINFADIASSPLLRKPSNHHHTGGLQTGFDTTKPPGDPLRANYDLFLNWILNGAPQ